MTSETIIWDGAALGAALRTQREHLGFRQADVAADLGFSARLISEIENGRETVAYGKILRYADYLAMDLAIRPRGGE